MKFAAGSCHIICHFQRTALMTISFFKGTCPFSLISCLKIFTPCDPVLRIQLPSRTRISRKEGLRGVARGAGPGPSDNFTPVTSQRLYRHFKRRSFHLNVLSEFLGALYQRSWWKGDGGTTRANGRAAGLRAQEHSIRLLIGSAFCFP